MEYYLIIINMLKLVNEMLFMQILFVCVTSIYDRRKFRCYLLVFITLESILIFFLRAQNRKVLFEYSNVIAFGNHCLNIQLPRHFLLIVLVTENHYI